MDNIISEFLIDDMAGSRDLAQYGNEKGLSVQHYLIKMLHQILINLYVNCQSKSFAVILNMIDWSHRLGVQSFIDNGVRSSLIPILINFFQDRTMVVKWKGHLSKPREMPGGGPQGGALGTIEYTSQTNHNTDFLSDDETIKFIDDLSILEVVNLILQGISSYNPRQQVPSDIAIGNKFIPADNLLSQNYLDKLSNWTTSNEILLNCDKASI